MTSNKSKTQLEIELAQVKEELNNARLIIKAGMGTNSAGIAISTLPDGKLALAELRQAEKEIQDALKYAENIVETIREPLVVLSSDLKILTANLSFYNTFKVSPEETIGKFIYDLGNRQWDIPRLRVLFENILPKDTVINNYEVEHDFQDIGHKVMLLNARQIYRENIGSQIILLAMEDITERKKLEQLLEQEMELLAVTMNSIGDGVISTDHNGIVTFVNKVAEVMTGWTREFAIGKNINEIFQIVDENTRETGYNPIEEVIKTGIVNELRTHTALISKTGEERLIADSMAPIIIGAARLIADKMAPIKNKNKGIVGAVIVFRDITEKQKILDNVQRVAKLESLGILAGGIAHDFNNLFTGIFGYLELAKESCPPQSDTIEFLIKALVVFNKARDLSQQLLTFATGGFPVKKITSLGPLINQSTSFTLSGSNVSGQINIAPDLWDCDVDETQIGQVLDNIILNARQSMELGGTIQVSASNLLVEDEYPVKPGKYLKISITDHGIGIPKEKLALIFDPFYTTKVTGTGLGLTTTYSIMQRHSGLLDVASEWGKGTTFTILIPAADKAAIYRQAAVVEKHSGHGKILIMDDEDYIQDIEAYRLKKMGYTVVAAKNSQEALAEFKKAIGCASPFDIVILDLTIPGGKGGIETLADIKKIDKSVNAVVSSGYSEDPVMANPSKYGFIASLKKPYIQKDLVAILNQIKNGADTFNGRAA